MHITRVSATVRHIFFRPKDIYILFITHKSHYCWLQAKDMIPWSLSNVLESFERNTVQIEQFVVLVPSSVLLINIELLNIHISFERSFFMTSISNYNKTRDKYPIMIKRPTCEEWRVTPSDIFSAFTVGSCCREVLVGCGILVLHRVPLQQSMSQLRGLLLTV